MTMKELKTQVDFVEALFVNFVLSMKEHMTNEIEKKNTGDYWGKNYMNKNCLDFAFSSWTAKQTPFMKPFFNAMNSR